MKEKTCDLSDITVVSGKKQESILGKGVRAPGDVAFHNVRNTKYETGPLFVVNKDYYVKKLSCEYKNVLLLHAQFV